jgi:6-phosphogluconolactonase (cycloisomerase 2 family)
MRDDAADRNSGFVYTQTNEPERNRVLVFKRADDGTLTPSGSYETGGAGDGTPHLASQGSVVLTGDGRHLLVTNTASDDMSVFAVSEDGLSLVRKVATGRAPKSIAEHDGLIYVLNTGDPSLIGFRLSGGQVEPLAGSTRELAAGTDPAQIGLSPDDATLAVTERGTNDIVCYPAGPAGELGEPVVQPSSGPTPYGFAFTTNGGLVVAEAFGAQAGKAAASSYVVSDRGVSPVSRSVGNGRSEICWTVITNDDRYAFTTNFADGAVSRYSIGGDGSIALDEAAAGLAVEGQKGLRDEDLSSDGRFLYAIDADSGRVFGWTVGEGGSLSQIGSWTGLPPTVAGLAAT